MSVNEKMAAIADAIRGKTGGTELLTLDNMATAIAELETGGGASDGVKVTEYVVTEDADRSLWFNEQGIKLVKGLNYLVIGGGALYGGSVVNNRSGLVVNCLILWDGITVTNSTQDTMNLGSHIRAFHSVSNGYSTISGASYRKLNSGNTSEVTVGSDGLLSFTTSATGVTTGNYDNSFIGAGNTYYLLQAESEVVC